MVGSNHIKCSILLYIVHCSKKVFKTHVTKKKLMRKRNQREILLKTVDPVLLKVFFLRLSENGWKKPQSYKWTCKGYFNCVKWIGFLNINHDQLITFEIYRHMFLIGDNTIFIFFSTRFCYKFKILTEFLIIDFFLQTILFKICIPL